MHEPLVDKDVFERVQILIRLKKRGNKQGVSNIFAGVIKCLDCGSNLTFRSYSGAGNTSGSFLCNRYRHASKSEIQRKTCTAHYLPYNGVYATTVTRINAVISSNMTEDDIVKHLSSNQEPKKAAQKAFDKLKRRNDELNRIIQKIVEQNALGEITSETFTRLYTGYITEQNEIAEKMKGFEAKFAAENRDKENARLFIEQIRKHSVSDELTREKILDLIEKIVVHEPTGDARNGTRRQRIEFYYRFVGKLPGSVCSL